MLIITGCTTSAGGGGGRGGFRFSCRIIHDDVVLCYSLKFKGVVDCFGSRFNSGIIQGGRPQMSVVLCCVVLCCVLALNSNCCVVLCCVV